MDLHELRVAARLIDGLAKRALFAEKQMVALEGQCAEWQRIADTLKEERNALRSARQDKAALLDAFGSLTDERDTLRKERDALRADVADLRTLCDQWKQRETELLAEIDRLKKPARNHPVAVGEWVERTESPYTNTPIGHKAQVVEVRHSTYRLSCGRVWEFRFCTPCDPPEASHDTPEGKQAAESAVKREPKPGDTVRLVRIPTSWDEQWGRVGDIAIIDSTGNEEVLLNSGWVWPISCIEILEDAK